MMTSDTVTPAAPADAPKREWSEPKLEVVPIVDTELHVGGTTAEGGSAIS